MDSTNALERVQRYMIERRQAKRVATVVGPFTVLLDPENDDIENNLACPHTPAIEAPEPWLAPLRAAFVAHGRKPAVQWIAGSARRLEAALQVAGFAAQTRETLLVCLLGELRPTPPMPGLTFSTITDTSPLAEVRENLDVNEFGFDPANAQPATDEQATAFRATLTAARAFTARLDGRAIAAGMYAEPHAGVVELAGIATLEPFRGQGFAAALTAHMAQAAFANGCDLVFLKTANPVAARVYERVGFQPIGEELTYVKSQ